METTPVGLLFYVFYAFGLAYIGGHSLITRRGREILYGFTLGWSESCGNGHLAHYGPRVATEPLPTPSCSACALAGFEGTFHPVDGPHFPFRWLVTLVECPACFGFWIGAVSGALRWIEIDSLGRVTSAIAVGCFTAGCNVLLGTLTHLMPETDHGPE